MTTEPDNRSRSLPELHNRPLMIDVERRAAATIVRLGGSCTMTESEHLGKRLKHLALESGDGPFIIDLSSLDFIDSIGIGGVVAAYLHCRRRQSELRLVKPQAEIRNMLELSKLTRIFRIFPSIEAALASTEAAGR